MARIRRRALTIAAVTSTALLGMAQTASASKHQMPPPDGGGYGYIAPSHQWVQVCDTDANNRGVRVEYTLDRPPGGPYIIGDANGSKPPCNDRHVGTDEIVSFRVCSSWTGGGGDRCTRWKWIGDH